MSRRAHNRRIVYYALVVFKTAESLDKLRDSKFLQKKINNQARKSVGFAANPFLAGESDLVA